MLNGYNRIIYVSTVCNAMFVLAERRLVFLKHGVGNLAFMFAGRFIDTIPNVMSLRGWEIQNVFFNRVAETNRPLKYTYELIIIRLTTF